MPAVIVPSFANAGLSLASDSAVVFGLMPSSSVTSTASPPALRDGHADDLGGEQPVLGRRGRALVASAAANSSCSAR